eukprot:245558_1
MCTMNIVYEYDTDDKVIKQFGTKQAKPMLVNTNLILQHIDQRRLYKINKGLTISIDMQIKYQYMNNDGDKSGVRIWRFRLQNFKYKIQKEFNWKISHNTMITCPAIYVSSLWITNEATVGQHHSDDINISNNKQFIFVCQENILIDEKCSINILSQGAIFCDDLFINGIINQMNLKRMVIVANTSNLTKQNLPEKINGYQKVFFAYLEQRKQKAMHIHDFEVEWKTYKGFKSFETIKTDMEYSFEVINQWPIVKYLDAATRCAYLKSVVFSSIIEQNVEDYHEEQKYDNEEQKYANEVFLSLSNFLNTPSIRDRDAIRTVLPTLIKDESFIKSTNFFNSQKCLNEMSLMEFMFFHCRYYGILNDIDCSDDEALELITGTKFFVEKSSHWLQRNNKSHKWFEKYPPTLCKISVTYEYSKYQRDSLEFGGEIAEQMIANPSAILNIDQTLLDTLNRMYTSLQECTKLTICIEELKIQYTEIDNINEWVYGLPQPFRVEIGSDFNWNGF